MNVERSHPIIRAIVRGGGGSVHDELKVAGLSWLLNNGYPAADFEVGGFDVLGISRSEDPLNCRVVIDAKASKGDLSNHFSKGHIADCNIHEAFSRYASLHYIIAREGVIKADAVHDPWGLLEEQESGAVVVTKEALTRAFIPEKKSTENDDLFEMACRVASILGRMTDRRECDAILKIAPKTFLDKGEAGKAIMKMREVLVRSCLTFETLYGYNPLARGYLEGKF